MLTFIYLEAQMEKIEYYSHIQENAIDKNPYSDYTPYKSEYGFTYGRSSYIFA